MQLLLQKHLNKCNMFFRSISLNVNNEDITEWARNILINSEGFSVLDSLIFNLRAF